MDELDVLKKHWQKDAVGEKQLSSSQLYPMLLKKSSSIVKTLFYISIAELVFWVLISFLPMLSTSYRAKMEASNMNESLLNGLTILSFVVILVFVYLLYKSNKKISVTDSAKKLMESIFKTRKVIKYYVGYNLIMAFITMVGMSYYSTTTNPELAGAMTKLDTNGKIIMCIIVLLITVAFVTVIWLFYKLLYGILMKRLNRNYNELKKLEV
ncbi:hypothetical protein [Lacinutrix sp. Hel_I_90]|uniref:hypothetical protein n=1 Tax=Lacinutrix sp. Hel_I_90 TaxID=1249999 RepID=UPI0005C8713B|nr:hypothetical protein [Lacinutrix sp. Hel_I_90]